MNRRIALYFAAGWAIFLVASASPYLLARVGLQAWLDSIPWLSHFIVKTVLAGLAVAAMACEGRPPAAFGFRGASPWRRRLLLAGLGSGVVASLLVLVTPARGMTGLFAGFGLVALVLSIWIYSSVTEEIFTRGWYQSAVMPVGDVGDVGEVGAGSRSAAIASSAILFGSMHLSLLWMGADLWTVAIIVTVTGLLGWAAAVARHQSGSLIPAILVHVLFNVGGFIAGVIYAIVTIARTGNPPVM
jgi:membrane protease YdiL (CAAX protease family)